MYQQSLITHMKLNKSYLNKGVGGNISFKCLEDTFVIYFENDASGCVGD